MKKKSMLLVLLVFALATAQAAEDWGRNGHRATGEIAENYLTKKAKRHIEQLLDGQSLALVSTYADEIKSDSKYRKYGPWHYVNFPFGATYETHPKNEKGDIITAIHESVEVLKDEEASKKDKVFYLKMLVHLIGDLHQPLHIGQAIDKGGNDFQVQWFKKGTNLHKVWDSKMIAEYKMSYSELAANQKELSKKELKQIQQGTIEDWMYESRALCENIYDNTKVGQKLWYPYMYNYMDVLRMQLQKGGIRLAEVLNDIFG
ncbi:S1/P1 nuclease [Marixanthomonas spongiae]|uniref:S1/P1 Nuclease n=1 Tax=Marixanthomonas spongiae TaxID=2174845 RepID=A0A2U0I5G2_9FLAO|nr:S1/P1 nuclease [Marixanthomonas spongiae]PVW16347.1 S1/P1 Nuclease [Marixanthomonas spongiae]